MIGSGGQVWTLNNADRCDRCGAQAFVKVTLKTGGSPLLFCGHHFRAYEPTLTPLASVVLDERERINARPSASSV